MALADDIRALRDRALAELAAAHDYSTDTKMSWRIVSIALTSLLRGRQRKQPTK
jgi:hypothetical protein